MDKKMEMAVLGGGCFWCTEAVFNSLKGVNAAVPGYTGGHVKHPSYEEVSMGKTGHVEAVKIEFDPQEITFTDLLTVFFATHDPTTVNRQGNDKGMQYRSIIFYVNEAQRKQAEQAIKEVQKSFSMPIVTKLEPFFIFYKAEDYHLRYYEKHRDEPYCQAVIDPKLEKLQKQFAELLKSHEKKS